MTLALREISICAPAAIVVEGYFDHLALYRAGVKNVVATGHHPDRRTHHPAQEAWRPGLPAV
ncbi:MAG: toprim domain-containing protein [Comamonadaceae bacterium]|nr:toprim domain-containing protein [Comamonadaceae bacterium]